MKKKVSQQSELEKRKTKVQKNCSKLCVTEAQRTAKQRLKALAAYLKRYTRNMEPWRIKRLFITEPSKVYSLGG